MKKLLSIASSLIIGTALLHAQGVIAFNSFTLGVLTNTAGSHFSGGSETGGISGKTASDSGSFTYALFIQTFTGSLSSTATNPLANGWNLATIYGTGAPVMATNRSSPFTGSLLGPGGITGVAIDGWALPTEPLYTSSGREYFMVAGWSTSLGSTWATFSPLLASGFSTATTPGFFGVSTVGNSYAGGDFSLNPQSLFVNNGQTIQSVGAFTLYEVAIPEPATLALAGLGSVSLLLFRRRK